MDELVHPDYKRLKYQLIPVIGLLRRGLMKRQEHIDSIMSRQSESSDEEEEEEEANDDEEEEDETRKGEDEDEEQGGNRGIVVLDVDTPFDDDTLGSTVDAKAWKEAFWSSVGKRDKVWKWPSASLGKL